MTNRILNITNILDTGAVDNWLVSVCEAGARMHPDWEWTFYCIDGKRGRLDDRVRSFGGKVVYSPHALHNKRAFYTSLRTFLKSHPHDILHSQHDLLSAVYLWAATGVPFRKRIVHIHNTQEEVPTPSQWKTMLLKEPMRRSCLWLADHLVGVSRYALSKFLGSASPRPERDRVLYCGIETLRFREPAPNAQEFRRSLGLAAHAKILLFVGRMVPQKNPLFLLDILQSLSKRDSSVAACFVGTGQLDSQLACRAREVGLADRIRLLGWRDDIPLIMKASDLLVFPNLEETQEGLGLVLVEAQAAGLPFLLSRSAPEEAIIVSELAHLVSLSAGPEVWAERAAEILTRPGPDRRTCLKKVEDSPFALAASAAGLMELYR